MITQYMTIGRHRQTDSIDALTRWVFGTLAVFTLLEAAFFPQMENLYGCFTFFVAWGFLYPCVLKLKGEVRNKCFFPYLALLGLGLTFFWLPLIATFVEGKPLTFRFAVPYKTFTLQLLNLMMLIAAYRCCLHLYRTNNPLQRLWKKMGYFTAPTDLQVWAMGVVGLVSLILLLTIQGTDEADAENLGFWGHLLGVTKSFISFPCLLLFKQLYSGNAQSTSKRSVFIYLGIMAVLSVATGKRTPIFLPVATLAFCYILPIITQGKRLFSTRNTILALIGVFLITGPVADLAMAMALGRDNTGQTSASKTFDNIWKIYRDKESLHTLYQISISNTDNVGNNEYGWSEYYVDNIILDRFCNIRVCDATIDYAYKLGLDNPKMQNYMQKNILYLLPTPILRRLGIYVNKFESQYTPGDLMSTEGLGLKHQYHGYRVAGDVGIGLYLWGYAYFFYAFLIYIVFFYFLSTKAEVFQNGVIIFALPAMNEIFRTLLTFNNDTGMLGVISTLLRTGWQNIILYCIIFAIIRKIVK